MWFRESLQYIAPFKNMGRTVSINLFLKKCYLLGISFTRMYIFSLVTAPRTLTISSSIADLYVLVFVFSGADKHENIEKP
ncbi:MAG: hypothetical protein QW101_01150 [Ignisphaera sp.]|uniref:Uncharacterized protein n=1 Tax=Ignisphaera aggregans TaxID=334771 RepID=A0A7J3MWC0_9CREN